ncbi:hypothetical protein [Corynebacterium amycolatum]|uniref:hypothetical protein n=1 Tax=Corynebacterium amycolatum TaxID=43765 RepID=UPI00254D25DB|nr:hypothetical protein [Corynebacterium amycolatum]MDK8726765.1 hypothetical protein [Corynebacterium amycolatum]
MTTIAELEFCIRSTQTVIKSAESTLERLRAELTELKAQEPEQESLFGRWAEHPELGRGFLISDRPDSGGDVRFACRKDGFTDGTGWIYVRLANLTLDPLTLTTEQDFESAPEGTIVEATMYPKDVAVKTEDGWYRTGGMHAIAVEYMPTCRVIRWGNGQ